MGLAEDNDYQSERNIQPKYELNPTAVKNSELMAQPNNVYSQNKRQENNFNSAAINLPSEPESNNFTSNFQTNTNRENNHMTPSSNLPYSPGEPSGSQNERQENNFNPGAIKMPPNPEYEARNNFPSNFQTNNYGANNHMTSSCNLPYSLTPGEANGNQNGSEPAYAGGWVHKSYKQSE